MAWRCREGSGTRVQPMRREKVPAAAAPRRRRKRPWCCGGRRRKRPENGQEVLGLFCCDSVGTICHSSSSNYMIENIFLFSMIFFIRIENYESS
jgi:hypothetical protein